MRGWIAAVLAATVLAGCSDDGGPRPDQSDLNEALGMVDVETTAKEGGIRGIVVDSAIRPLAGIHVRLMPGNLTTTSDSGGVFVFSTLAPGTYFVHLSGLGYFPTQTSIDVTAGQVADARLMIEADRTPIPFHETIRFEGFIDLAIPLASYIVDIVLQNVANQTVCAGCYQWVDASGNVTTIVFELVWQPTTAPPPGAAELYYQFYDQDSCAGTTIQSEYTTGPVLEHWLREEIWGPCDQFLVHYGGGSDGVSINQDFESFITLWHNGPAPPGWSFVKTTE